MFPFQLSALSLKLVTAWIWPSSFAAPVLCRVYIGWWTVKKVLNVLIESIKDVNVFHIFNGDVTCESKIATSMLWIITTFCWRICRVKICSSKLTNTAFVRRWISTNVLTLWQFCCSIKNNLVRKSSCYKKIWVDFDVISQQNCQK